MVYTNKDGFVNRGKIAGGDDIVDSYKWYKTQEAHGFVTEKRTRTTTLF